VAVQRRSVDHQRGSLEVGLNEDASGGGSSAAPSQAALTPA